MEQKVHCPNDPEIYIVYFYYQPNGLKYFGEHVFDSMLKTEDLRF